MTNSEKAKLWNKIHPEIMLMPEQWQADEFDFHGTCHEILKKYYPKNFQPERSKREDLECCERSEWLEKRIQDRKDGKLFPKYDFKNHFLTLDEELLKLSKMRCSEHNG